MAQSLYYSEKQKKNKEKISELSQKLPDYMRRYIGSVELSGKSDLTTIAYARELLTFLDYIREKNPVYQNFEARNIPFKCMENLTYLDLDEYQRYLTYNTGENRHRRSDAALNRAMCALRGYFSYEVAHDYLPKDPTLGMARSHRIRRKPIDRLDHEEVARLLQGVECSESGTEHSRAISVHTQLRDTAIVTLLLSTGIRISECVGLDLNDINLKKQSLRIVRKGGNIQDVFFNEEALWALTDYISLERPHYIESDDEPALFLSNRKKRMAVRSIQAMLEKYGAANLDRRGNLHPHTLRKTFGTELYRLSSDIRLTADALGHSDINTTAAHYAASNVKKLEDIGKISLYKNDNNK